MNYLTASVHLPVSTETAFYILSDLNTILRLSPAQSIKDFKRISADDNQLGAEYEVVLEEYESKESRTCQVVITEYNQPVKICYTITGWKAQQVVFSIEKTKEGVRLTQQFLVYTDADLELKGIQKELAGWLHSIGEYLKLAEGRRLDKIVCKWLMDTIWLRCSLSERKIAIIMVTFSIAEIFLLVVLVIAWNLFILH